MVARGETSGSLVLRISALEVRSEYLRALPARTLHQLSDPDVPRLATFWPPLPRRKPDPLPRRKTEHWWLQCAPRQPSLVDTPLLV